MRTCLILCGALTLTATPTVAIATTNTVPPGDPAMTQPSTDPAMDPSMDPGLAGNVVDPATQNIPVMVAVPADEPATEAADSGGGGFPWGIAGLVGLIGLLGRNRS